MFRLLNPSQDAAVDVSFTAMSPGCDQVITVSEGGRLVAQLLLQSGQSEQIVLSGLVWDSGGCFFHL